MRVTTHLRLAGILAGFVFILAGCAVFFTDGARYIGVIPREPGGNVVFRTTLRGDTMGINFRCPANALINPSQDRVRVTLVNLSKSTKIDVTAKRPGPRSMVEPGASVYLYEGSLAELMSGQVRDVRLGSLYVRPEKGRVRCQLEILFLSLPKLREPIEVLSAYSSAPL